jgi:hypothetical protein
MGWSGSDSVHHLQKGSLSCAIPSVALDTLDNVMHHVTWSSDRIMYVTVVKTGKGPDWGHRQ